jgi:hypothetical protein
MKLLPLLFLGLFLQNAHAFDVHEWGTFTSLVGSNGQRQDGMFYEDEVLPDFVHNFWDGLPGQSNLDLQALATVETSPAPVTRCPTMPRCPIRKMPMEFIEGQAITQKMETPVLYFHSDKPFRASVHVDFPEGVISQTFPSPVASLPTPVPGVELKNGYARFDVDVLVNTNLTPPTVPAGNIYGHARNVVANTISSNDEVEKFIFYRGLGKFEANLFITSLNGSITLVNKGDDVRGIFLVNTTGEHGSITALGDLVRNNKLHISKKSIDSTPVESFDVFAKKAKDLLTKSLVETGLNLDEAVAMVETWEHGYFKTPGLRVLYVLNRSEVEKILPMKITPQPAKLERAFVGRVEVLRDTEEREILNNVLKLRTKFNILSLGRFAPAMIKRVEQIALEKGLLDQSLEKVFRFYDTVIAENM